MTTKEHEFVSDLVLLLEKHGFTGFVGSFVGDSSTVTDILTTKVVAPGYDKTPFETVERSLLKAVYAAFNVKETGREVGHFIAAHFGKKA